MENSYPPYVTEPDELPSITTIDGDHYIFTLWQMQLIFVVFCASSACGVSVEHMNAKKPMIRSIYCFHVHYHIRRILQIIEIPLPYENSFNQYNNPYNHEKLIKSSKVE